MESLFERARREFPVTKIYHLLTGREAQAGKFQSCPVCQSSRFQVGQSDKAWTCWAGNCHEASGSDALGLAAAVWGVDRTNAAYQLLDVKKTVVSRGSGGAVLGRLVSASTETPSRAPKPLKSSSEPVPEPSPELIDNPVYQSWLSEIVEKAQGELMSRESELGRRARAYLYHERKLSVGTMRAYGLGIVEHWHITKSVIPGRELKVAPGLLIPWTKPGGYAGGNVREFHQPLPNKYLMISGSRRRWLWPGPLCGWDLTWSYRGPLLIVEGEFDCMVAQQALAGLVAVKTLGSATTGPGGLDGDERAQLSHHTKILIAADSDKAGEECRAVWNRYSRRAVSLALPSGKDLTEAAAAGIDLRAWFLSELDRLNISLCDSLEPGCYEAINWAQNK